MQLSIGLLLLLWPFHKYNFYAKKKLSFGFCFLFRLHFFPHFFLYRFCCCVLCCMRNRPVRGLLDSYYAYACFSFARTMCAFKHLMCYQFRSFMIAITSWLSCTLAANDRFSGLYCMLLLFLYLALSSLMQHAELVAFDWEKFNMTHHYSHIFSKIVQWWFFFSLFLSLRGNRNVNLF